MVVWSRTFPPDRLLAPAPDMRHVVFGYGSLICPKSRATTAPSLANVVAEPAIVANIERSWCVRVVTGVRVVTASSSSSSSSSSSCSNNKSRAETTATTPTTARQQQQQQQQTSVRRIGYTPVGVQFKHGAECNGVLMHISEDELRRFDEREGKFYTRRRVDITDIRRHYDSCDGSVKNTTTTTTTTTTAPTEKDVKCSVCKEIFDMASSQRNSIATAAAAAPTTSSNRLEHGSSSNNNNNDIAVWIYVPKSEYTAFATPSCPIIQSYIDIIIRGCLSISNDFARQFLLSTRRGWWYHGCHEGSHDNKGEEDDYDIAKKNVAVVVRSDETTGGGSSAADNSSNDVGGRYHYHNMWVNDRSSPIYTRADIDYSMIHGQLIDELIEEYHHSALQHRMDIQ